MIRSMFFATLFGALHLEAANLPESQEKEWIGSWIGHEENEFLYSVLSKDGKGELFPKIRGKNGYAKAGVHDNFQIYFILEEMKGGQWTRIGIKEDGFETGQAASGEVKDCEVVATYDNGSKAKIRHRFERKGIALSTVLEHKATENPTRVGILVMTPAVYNVTEYKKVPSEEEMEKMMKDDEIRAIRVDGKQFKFKLNEQVILSDAELLGDGATEFSIESKRYGGKPIRMAAAAKDGGKILFRQSKRLFQMYSATWYPAESKVPGKASEVLIEFK